MVGDECEYECECECGDRRVAQVGVLAVLVTITDHVLF